VIAQAVRAYSNRSLTLPVTRLSPNVFLLSTCLIVVAVQVLIPLVPPLADAFRASPLSTWEWATVAGVALLPPVVAELVRRIGRGPWVA
jgi:magnesium-transporting ATPase (P-type)